MENKANITINTGNILSLDDITKKSALNTTEELLEAIQFTLRDHENGVSGTKLEDDGFIFRKHDNTQIKLSEYDQNDLKIGLKIFINKDNSSFVLESVEKAFQLLNVTTVHSVIVAYTYNIKQEINEQQCDTWKNIWSSLEQLVMNKKVSQIGVADVEVSTFKSLYQWAEIKPSIIQINLATCCVVPPTLQTFCKEHDVQLLTHSDSVDILPESRLSDIFNRSLSLKWALRYLVHVKCRGVLITKGYLLCLDEIKS